MYKRQLALCLAQNDEIILSADGPDEKEAVEALIECLKTLDPVSYTHLRAIYSVLAYNTTQIDKAPKDWDDVTTDDYKGSLAIANPAYSGGAMTTLSVHVEPVSYTHLQMEDTLTNTLTPLENPSLFTHGS